MSKKQIVGLLIMAAVGAPSFAFAKEASWWTRHKQVCELPKDLTHVDWLAQGSPCELYAIAARKEKEKARRKEIRDAEREAQKKVTQLANEKARKKEMLLAQEKALKMKNQLAQEKALKKEIQLAEKQAREEDKRLAKEKALEKKIQLAQEKARQKEIQLAEKQAREKDKRLAKQKTRINALKLEQPFALDTAKVEEPSADNQLSRGLIQPPDMSVEVSAARSIVVNEPSRAAIEFIRPTSSSNVDLRVLLARMVKYNRSLEGIGEVAAEVCQGLGLCDGSTNMPVKLSVGESADSKFYFGVPLAETAPEILIMVETGSMTEVYLTDLTGTLSAGAINDGEYDRSINYKEVSKGFAAALDWVLQAAKELEPAR
ncbi:MAG: hypothetical protein ACI9FR_002137 [Cryomorphaceae bacterium]|jgi:hypothetical protein